MIFIRENIQCLLKESTACGYEKTENICKLVSQHIVTDSLFIVIAKKAVTTLNFECGSLFVERMMMATCKRQNRNR